jgi:hypothetical protein
MIDVAVGIDDRDERPVRSMRVIELETGAAISQVISASMITRPLSVSTIVIFAVSMLRSW